jgi:hypothetical protein
MHGHGDLSERGTPEEIFSRFEDLERYNLAEPTLTQLFRGLREQGLDFGNPIRVGEAVQSIKSWLEKDRKNH